jgi:hypothetical protein
MHRHTIFKFNKNTNLQNWKIVDDEVMGGCSKGEIDLSPEGLGRFSGKVSLENNGGFSSVRFIPVGLQVDPQDNIAIRLKGDGKRYQFRVKHDRQAAHSYVTYFETSGKWEEITILLEDLYPTFRGRKLDQPNFNHEMIQELGFLIGNKKEQDFELLIDRIALKTP